MPSAAVRSEPARPEALAPPRIVEVPRPGGGVRRLAALDPADARAYAEVVARLAPAIERSLGPEVMADRAMLRGPAGSPAGLVLEPWRRGRDRWGARLRRVLHEPAVRAVLTIDVQDCFGSMTAHAVGASLRACGGREGDVAAVTRAMERWAEAGVRGLPVGPAASAVVANAVLGAIDRALRDARVPHVRWVDDVVAATGSPADARRARDAVRRALDASGLREHPRKTGVLVEPAEVAARILRGRTSPAGASPVR